MGANIAILIAHRARGANHEKKPASKVKRNETIANASSVLLVASPTLMKIAIPLKPMKNAKMENAIPISNPDLLCISSILSALFYMERANGWCLRLSGENHLTKRKNILLQNPLKKAARSAQSAAHIVRLPRFAAGRSDFVSTLPKRIT